MHDFMCSNYQDMYYKILRNEVQYFKDTEGGKQKICEIMDEIRENGRKEGNAEGKIDILKQQIKKN